MLEAEHGLVGEQDGGQRELGDRQALAAAAEETRMSRFPEGVGDDVADGARGVGYEAQSGEGVESGTVEARCPPAGEQHLGGASMAPALGVGRSVTGVVSASVHSPVSRSRWAAVSRSAVT